MAAAGHTSLLGVWDRRRTYRIRYGAKYGSCGIRKPTVRQDTEADLAPQYGTNLIRPYMAVYGLMEHLDCLSC
jgi:hypothetical protein